MKTNISINLIYILICSLPYALITGPFLPDFLVTFVAILFVIISIKERMWIYYKNNFFKLFIIFYVIINLSAIFSEVPYNSIKISIPYIRFGLFSLAIILIINNKKNFEIIFLKNITIVISVLLLDGVLQYFSGESFLGWVKKLLNLNFFDDDYSLKMSYKIASVFGDKGVYGSYLLRFSPLFIYLIIKTNLFKKYTSLLILVFCNLIFIAILFSGERSSLILFVILIFFNLIFIKNNKSLKLLIVFLISLFLIFILIFNKDLNKRYVSTTKYLILSLNMEKNKNEIIKLENKDQDLKYYNSVTNYTGLFKIGLLMFEESPLFGKGPRAFKYLSADERFSFQNIEGKKTSYYNTHPHNFYIQLLAETGIAGFGFVFLFFFYLVAKYFTILNLYKKNTAKFELLIAGIPMSGLIFHLWPVISTGSFFTNYNCILIYMCLGFFLGEKSTNYK